LGLARILSDIMRAASRVTSSNLGCNGLSIQALPTRKP
jgi:hypothetical protein